MKNKFIDFVFVVIQVTPIVCTAIILWIMITLHIHHNWQFVIMENNKIISAIEVFILTVALLGNIEIVKEYIKTRKKG